MKSTWIASVASVLLSMTGAADAQSASERTSSSESASNVSAGSTHVENGVPISRLLATVAKKTGKKFVVDPQVRGDAEIVGQDAANISYGDLLTILHLYGYTAVEYGGYVNVIPSAGVRQLPVPQVSGRESRPEAEFVSKVITVKNVPATHLVPLLRPIMPQAGHLVALPCVNKLFIVDTFGNVQRIQTIVEALDVGEPYTPEKCAAREAWMTPGPASLPAATHETTVDHR
jgi:type II secretory pathway component GspD/PulD (secretin)